LDLDRTEARECLLKLAAASGIVVENYSPRVMANWGLTYDRLKEANPSLIMLSLSAMGQSGPWKDYIGFGPTFHALSGLMAASSGEEGSPITIGHAYGDVVIGLYAAIAVLAALEFRNQAGKGLHIDLSGYEALCTMLGPALIRPGPAVPDSEMPDGAFPDRCYPCKGIDRWCALTIGSDEEWNAFRRIMNDPVLKSERFDTEAGRKENLAELDAGISRWTSARTAESVSELLQEAGIASSAVQGAEAVAGDAHLAARNFFVSLKHPLFGVTTADRSALWPWDRIPETWRAAPALGKDNHDIFVRLLGMPETTFRAFVERGIIG
jgi:benzylsuccinate CoA-transferase BbsF subunit